MKKIVLLFSFALYMISLSAKAQHFKSYFKQADQYFSDEDYQKSLLVYQRVLELDSLNAQAYFKSGECYRVLFQYHQAFEHYKKATSLNPINHLNYYYTGLMSEQLGNIDRAVFYFEKFISYKAQLLKQDSIHFQSYLEQAKLKVSNAGWVKKLLANETTMHEFQRLPETINSEFNDYSVTLYQGDSIFFISSGRFSNNESQTINKYGDHFSEFHLVQAIDTSHWQISHQHDMLNALNSEYEEGAGFYDAIYNEFYLTSCRQDGGGCEIYKSSFINGKWTTPLALNRWINLPKTSSKHPSLNATADTLYFSSDRPGGYGGFDIWFSTKNEKGQWGEPTNLGNTVNTRFNEISPFVSTNGDLFIASNGHKGIGGYDIYQYNVLQKNIENLGPPFNSSYDDCFYIEGDQLGFVTSNRPGSLGKFDIYSFKIINQIQEEVAKKPQDDLLVFSDDYHHRLISYATAARIYGVKLPYIANDEVYYQRIDEQQKKNLLNKIETSISLYSSRELDDIRKEDELFYNNLPLFARKSIDRIAHNIMTKLKSPQKKLNLHPIDAQFYNSLDNTDKFRFDRILAFRVSLTLFSY
ncbi:tetratricopeptide repeat protein [Rapidithrix thailandica]|uniref:Tetratricopeptide repeat protein n=1 Tax=Rapidithrix thailandica TaxID=413964 RepID=A0AAW9SHQ9_9BACT